MNNHGFLELSGLQCVTLSLLFGIEQSINHNDYQIIVKPEPYSMHDRNESICSN